MLLKLEIFETIPNIYSSELTIDIKNKMTIYKKGNITVKEKKCPLSDKELSNLVTDYTTYWPQKTSYKTDTEKRIVKIIVTYEKETSEYCFVDEFPTDLEEFMKTIKNKLEIEE